MKIELNAELSPDISRQIIAMVKLHTASIMEETDTRNTVDTTIERVVSARIGQVIRDIVQRQIREEIASRMDAATKFQTIDATIRNIVTDLFTARFGKAKEAT